MHPPYDQLELLAAGGTSEDYATQDTPASTAAHVIDVSDGFAVDGMDWLLLSWAAQPCSPCLDHKNSSIMELNNLQPELCLPRRHAGCMQLTAGEDASWQRVGKMPHRRVMGDAIVLCDGTIGIFNGAGAGLAVSAHLAQCMDAYPWARRLLASACSLPVFVPALHMLGILIHHSPECLCALH